MKVSNNKCNDILLSSPQGKAAHRGGEQAPVERNRGNSNF